MAQTTQLKPRQAKPLKYKELPGITAAQLAPHHDVLYVGYVKKLEQIQARLQEVEAAAEGVNATYAEVRELKLEETFAANGVRLHEAYFDNLTPNGNVVGGRIKQLLERDYGSVDNWLNCLRNDGMAARGWVVLAYDLEDHRLQTYTADVHNQGGVWNCVSLLVLDVYEHAYFVDYKTGRKDYIEAFIKNIDWNEVNQRIEKFGALIK